jgi:hypothetical protein
MIVKIFFEIALNQSGSCNLAIVRLYHLFDGFKTGTALRFFSA